MLKKKPYIIINILLILLIMSFFSYAEDNIIPDYILIGLKSGSSAVAMASLSSERGLVFGYRMDGGFVNLYDFANVKKIYVRKDSYYNNFNDYFYEYNFDINLDSSNSNIIGPIHIQFNGSYSSKSEAIAFIDQISVFGLEPFLVLEDKWKVWVGTYTTYDAAEKSFNELRSLLPDVEMTVISKNTSRIQVTDEKGKIMLIYNPAYGKYYFESGDGNTPLALDNKYFRGSILFINAPNGNLTVINRLKMDEYLYGVLPKEMSYTAPAEALKAQAVAARNFAVVNKDKHKNEGFNLCATSNCQTYGGYSSENPGTNKAVDDTSGIILTYNGEPISAYYHSHSGGHTEDCENVWGGSEGYLIGVEDNLGENYYWEVSLTKDNISKSLLTAGYASIGSITNIYEGSYSRTGSVLELVIEGTEGKIVLEKDNIRKVLGYNTIKSLKFNVGEEDSVKVMGNNQYSKQNSKSLFIIDGKGNISSMENIKGHMYNGSTYVQMKENSTSEEYFFSGRGYGHGIGMSQEGAVAMANLGYTYKEILYHYYTDVLLTKN